MPQRPRVFGEHGKIGGKRGRVVAEKGARLAAAGEQRLPCLDRSKADRFDSRREQRDMEAIEYRTGSEIAPQRVFAVDLLFQQQIPANGSTFIISPSSVWASRARSAGVERR